MPEVGMEISFKNVVRFGFLLGLGGLISMLPFSKIVISISEFLLAGAWALDRYDLQMFRQWLHRDSRVKAAVMMVPYAFFFLLKSIADGFRALFRNKPALIFFSLYFLHVAGLIFTTDFDYAWKDLRTKVPIALLPLSWGLQNNLAGNGSMDI